MFLQGVDFSPCLKRIIASKLSLKMRDRSHRENKANRIFNINISEEKITQSVGFSVHAVKKVVSICSENPSMGVCVRECCRLVLLCCTLLCVCVCVCLD